jgi:exopolysaccharide biosynthesis WecB/TagA/CpsF family protein
MELHETKPLAIVDGQPIHVADMSGLVSTTIARLKRGQGFTLYTFNMDHLVKRRVDPLFRSAYSRATYVTADGAPVVWLARRAGAKVERTTGADLLRPMCAAAAETGLPVAFFGSNQASLATAAGQLTRDYPRLNISYFESPPQGFDPFSEAAEAAMARIAHSGARLCFVALGAPKQELFSDRMRVDYPSVGFFGIGAALDFVSGQQTRAPQFMRSRGLEWAWRLATNPLRLAPRYFACARALADVAILDPLWRRLSSQRGAAQ